jgi:alkylation response protein AidB-like acyl-CoA dehydrogenase
MIELRAEVSAQDEAFRDELRDWLAQHPGPPVDIATTRAEADALRAWQRTMHGGGWVGIQWPVEHGGRGASPSQIAIYNEELARAGAPPLIGRGGISLVGPTLMAHGTDEQRRRWMPRILAGDDVWCQLFSEPGAGSDLAGLTTRAERHGDRYVLNGQKVWSSYAQFADYAICLARTDPDAPNHKGISMIAIPMTERGIDIRPLRQITGKSEFNEVFLDDVEVPLGNLIGPEHEGWRVTSTTLANERGASFIWKEQVLHEAAMERLIAVCRARGVLVEPHIRQRLMTSWIEVEIFRLLNARTRTRLARGEPLGPESSIVKLFWSGLSQRLHDTAVVALGPDALLMPGDPAAVDDGRWAVDFLAARATSIMGGTSEIQHNILGERLLGLPREPKPREPST